MILEKQEKKHQEHMNLLFAWIQNPYCERLIKTSSSTQTKEDTPWKPRQRFTEWAFQQENLQRGFSKYFECMHLSIDQKARNTVEGSYTRNPLLSFSTPNRMLQICPDAIVIHNNQEKIIEVCCQPDRKGNTNRYALQKSRLRAAIYSYALNPNNPSSSAFIVLHRWSHLVVHELSIEQELQQIYEAMRTKNHIPYHFIPSCRWFCSHSEKCQAQAQREGAPIAWSLSLQNIVHTDVWSAKEELSQDTSSPLNTIAHFYKKAFPEKM